jgi:transposase
MPLEFEMIHPQGLRFVMQRKLVMLRDVKHQSFVDIAPQLKNRAGGVPTEQTVANYYDAFSSRLGRVKTKYANCGRQAWKFTPETEKLLLKLLLRLRKECVCTSTTLQYALAREHSIKVSASGVRKVLGKHGYSWLPKSKKRVYSKEDRQARVAFGNAVMRMSKAQLRSKLSLAIDGVILIMPPSDPTDRYNYCRFGEDHIYRKPSEGLRPDIQGGDAYGKQAPLARCVPMWGGCGGDGFGILAFHKTKKLSQEEWMKALQTGAVKKAILATNPPKKTGPWHLLCDNEGFLECKAAKKLYTKLRINMWHVPPRSPDLNPVEKFWAWLRKKLRALDLKDAVSKRAVLGKTAYRERVRRVLKSQKARTVAKNCALGLRKVCKQVVQSGGIATRG